jgi:integrase
MASLHKSQDGYRVRWREQRRQRVLFLGKVSKTNADRAKVHVEHLIEAKQTGERAPAPTRQWTDKLKSNRIRKRLIELELVKQTRRIANTDADKLLGPFIDRCIKDMVDAAPNTIRNHKQARRVLVAHFDDGETKRIDSITPADLERWQRSMRKTLARATRNKHIQHVKKFFATAVKERLLDESPADGLREDKPTPKERNNEKKQKQYHVDTQLTAEVLEGLPAGEITLAFVLARFQGMRRVEIFNLRLNDIDWERSKMEISEDGKTGWRECPIFPQTMPYIRQAFHDAPERATKVFRSFSSEHVMTPIMKKHIEAVIGKKRMWPAVLQQLRKTRRNELEGRFPGHVVNEWMGHTKEVAESNYLEVTPEHWQKALTVNPSEGISVADFGNTGGNTLGNTEAHRRIDDSQNAVKSAVRSSAVCHKASKIPPSRVELLFLD